MEYSFVREYLTISSGKRLILWPSALRKIILRVAAALPFLRRRFGLMEVAEGARVIVLLVMRRGAMGAL